MDLKEYLNTISTPIELIDDLGWVKPSILALEDTSTITSFLDHVL
jgi:hypothetical protein